MKGKASKGRKATKVEEKSNVSDTENDVESEVENVDEDNEVASDTAKKVKRSRNVDKTDKSESGTSAKRRKPASTKNDAENHDNHSEHSEDNNVENDKEDDEEEEEEKKPKGKKGTKESKSKKTVEKKSAEKETDSTKDKDEEPEEYEVEKIVDDRKVKGKRQFKIHWKGYPSSSDTWEAEADLSCPAIIKAYLEAKEDEKQVEKEKKPDKKDKKSKKEDKTATDESEEEVSKEEYEVESIQDVKFMKNGKREFLVRWKGYKKNDDTWEPEEHLNCSDLIEKYMEKVDKAKAANQPALRVAPKTTKRLTLTEKGRRASKRNPQKERVTYFDQDE